MENFLTVYGQGNSGWPVSSCERWIPKRFSWGKANDASVRGDSISHRGAVRESPRNIRARIEPLQHYGIVHENWCLRNAEVESPSFSLAGMTQRTDEELSETRDFEPT